MRLKRIFVKLLLLLLTVFPLAGCGGGSRTNDSTSNGWNFLVYMDGDNNLEEAAINDFNEMEAVGSTADVNIYVLIDRISGYDSSNGDWTGTRLYKIVKDTDANTIHSTLIENYNELDMSDPDTLSNFIIKCNQLAPNRKTVLTLWNHGGGVWPRSILTRSATNHNQNILKGICWDDTTGSGKFNCLTTDEVAAALKTARDATGKKINIINMDACLMQMLEVAYELNNEDDFNEVDYLVGSQEVVAGDGNDYTALLKHLTARPNMDANLLARNMVADYYNFYNDSDYDTTYSALKLGTEFTTLMAAFKQFATALNSDTFDLQDAIAAWKQTTYFNYPEENDLYDFADELEKVSSNATIQAAAQAVKTAIGNVVIAHRETGTFVGNAYGLSILLAQGTQWDYYSAADQYTNLSLAKNTKWDDFLRKFAAATTSATR